MSMEIASEEELGESVSLEGALSIMVVIFLLRLVLFVPMMMIDKVNVEKAQRATFWSRIDTFVQKGDVTETDKIKIEKYFEAFTDLNGKKNTINIVDKNLVIIESVDGKENVMVILHDLVNKTYVMMISQEFSNELIYRHGSIQEDAGQYFTSADEVAYTSNPLVMDMKNKYVDWVKKTRNIIPNDAANQNATEAKP